MAWRGLAWPGTAWHGTAGPGKAREIELGVIKMSDLKPVLVRTYSAGVHFGYLKSRNGKEVELERSRRIWRWSGAWTLSEIATAGLDAKNSKVAAPVSIVLTEAIEIIDCMPAAVEILEAATWSE
jgi:hypothetical protein